MRFKVYYEDNKEDVIKFCDQFCKESKKEFERVRPKLKKLGINLPPFEIGILEDDDHLILWDSTTAPIPIGIFKKRHQKTMKKDLEEYLRDCGLKCRVDIIDK